MTASRDIDPSSGGPSRPARRRLGGIAASAAIVAATTISGVVMLGTTPVSATASSVKPNSQGMLDCNGYSKIQKSVAGTAVCTDIRGFTNAHNSNTEDGRFYDNGHYIGHDEPSVTYLSLQSGSGDNVTWTETLGRDPSSAPTVHAPGGDVTHYFELTPAPWFSMDVCDSNSYPQLSCSPENDNNAPSPGCIFGPCGSGQYPGAGSAFTELQFYPPGFTPPWTVGVSCDNTHWCAALTIDSLECTWGFANCNPNCIEPVNFAFIATNGQPAGPPNPQQAGLSTFLPNSDTLLMNPGDKITTHLFDAPVPGQSGQHALMAVVSDLTTGKTGWMQASAANGFMHTSIVDCSGTPFNFEPEYNTAARDNIVPWAALQGTILTQFEIGHFEPCTSLSGTGTFTISGHSDPYYQTCNGPYENRANNPDGSSSNAEVGDAPCFYKGDTHPAFGGTAPDTVTGCMLFFDQNGDLDYDGSSYYRDWPDSTSPNTFPSTFVQAQPKSGSNSYPQFFFQTDAALSESTCTGTTGCTIPPQGPGGFYPYWTLTSCHWEFGHMSNGNSFGGMSAEYGTNQINSIGYPEFMSQVRQNSCT